MLPIRQFQAHQLKAPRDFQAIPAQPICLEIGAGKGKHALQFAAQHPQTQLYAVERTREKFTVMQQLHAQAALHNLNPVHADAIPWVVHALRPQQLEQCFILYPNPERHNPAQRWLNMPFFEFLLSRLMPNGCIRLASNIPEYMDEAEQQLRALWQLPYDKFTIPNDSARTHFEIKYLARGELCQELIICKPEGYRTRFDDVVPPTQTAQTAQQQDAEH